MVMPTLLLSCGLLLTLILVGCERARPEAADMKAEFVRRYPTAEVVSIRMSEDEVVARSFDITYRVKGSQETKNISLQYMEGDKGVWELRPAPPDQLP
jgi:hypothetical protein